jgi:UDP-glucuronate 4-epimerase
VGFLNILEACRQYHVDNLCFASSSSVYGLNTKVPFSTKDNVDHPVSLYAATKKADELMAHTYSHLYGIRATGLRFFTVYGPWGRPDMAYYKFVKAALEDKPIEVYNNGEMQRDFTYIDDIVEGVVRVIDSPAEPSSDFATNPSPDRSSAPYRIYNIGNNHPIRILDLIQIIENILRKRIEIITLPKEKADMTLTYADTSAFKINIGFSSSVSLESGMNCFIDWFRYYQNILLN